MDTCGRFYKRCLAQKANINVIPITLIFAFWARHLL